MLTLRSRTWEETAPVTAPKAAESTEPDNKSVSSQLWPLEPSAWLKEDPYLCPTFSLLVNWSWGIPAHSCVKFLVWAPPEADSETRVQIPLVQVYLGSDLRKC